MKSSKSYRLRRMYESDLKSVHKWRNHASVRNVSGSNHRFTLAQHRHWFDCSTSTHKFIFTEEEEARGVILFDTSGQWSFYLVPGNGSRHRRGLGRLMLSLFLVYAKEEGFEEVRGVVNKDNEKSHELHKSLGFKLLAIYANGDREYRKGL